jgi:hypothetical protein
VRPLPSPSLLPSAELSRAHATNSNPFAYGNAPAALRGSTWGLERDEALAYFEREDAKRRRANAAGGAGAGAPRAEGAAERDGELLRLQSAKEQLAADAADALHAAAERLPHEAVARGQSEKADVKSVRQ